MCVLESCAAQHSDVQYFRGFKLEDWILKERKGSSLKANFVNLMLALGAKFDSFKFFKFIHVLLLPLHLGSARGPSLRHGTNIYR